MNLTHPDPVLAALESLAAPAPAQLSDRIFTRWLTAPSRLGEVFVAFTGAGVQYLRTAGAAGDGAEFAAAYRDRFARPLRPADRAPAGLLPALLGRRSAALRLDLDGLSGFERAVLAATRAIPAGQTRPYSWIAREAGSAGASRAVGSVLARNPLPLLIPCHRVVRADGALGEYMFGAAHKEELLRAERVNLDEAAALAARGVHFLGSDTTGIVCFPTCAHARRIIPAHRRGFRSVAAAVTAGYRPCRHCRPAAAAIPA